MMAEIKSSGTFDAGCQHVNLTCELVAGKTPTTNTSVAQISQFRCTDCGVALYAIGQNSKPAEYIRVPLITTAPEAAKKKPDPSLARSKINRDGLKAGTLAPEFKLPSLDGAEVALADYRGRRVLLVFFGNQCGHCDTVSPDLQQLHESGFPVLIVNQKDADTARVKAIKLGLTMPIVMQKQWEISKLYGIFAAPVAYLIGSDGVIEADVAVGAPAVQELIRRLHPASTPV